MYQEYILACTYMTPIDKVLIDISIYYDRNQLDT